MPPSTKVAPVSSITRAMRSTVAGSSALQSTKIGFFAAARRAGARRSARPSASPGGRIDRMMSEAAICSSGHADHAGRLGARDGVLAAAGERGAHLDAVLDEALADGAAHHAWRDHCDDRLHGLLSCLVWIGRSVLQAGRKGKKARVHTEGTENARRATEKEVMRCARSCASQLVLCGSRCPPCETLALRPATRLRRPPARATRAALARPHGRTAGCSPRYPCGPGTRPARRTADARCRPSGR